MNSDETFIEIPENISSAGLIPSMVERWCDDSEPIKGGITEVYAIYSSGAVSPVSTELILETDEVIAV